MSGSLHTWYSLPDLDVFAARQTVLRGEIELKRLTRLRDMLHADSGSVSASLRFQQRSGGWLALELEYETSLQLVCQRCLDPMSYALLGQVQMGLLESAAAESSLPESYEPVVLDSERLLPERLIEDELIVSLPLVPRHASLDDCGSLARTVPGADRGVSIETQEDAPKTD